MRLTVRYMAQVKHAAGTAGDEVQLDAPCTVRELLAILAQRRGEALRRMLLDSAGQAQPTILIFLGDRQVWPDELLQPRDGEVLTILSPIAGGQN